MGCGIVDGGPDAAIPGLVRAQGLSLKGEGRGRNLQWPVVQVPVADDAFPNEEVRAWAGPEGGDAPGRVDW
jgi:hypothetical protein